MHTAGRYLGKERTMFTRTILTWRLATALGTALFFGLLACGCNGGGGSADGSTSYTPLTSTLSPTSIGNISNIELLTNKEYDSPGLQALYPKWGVKVAKIAYSPYFTADAGNARPGLPIELQWSETKLKSWLDKNVPTEFDGYLCLDWEEPFAVLQDVGHVNHYAVVEQMRSLLMRVQVLRPHVKVGYYGLPFNQYWPIFHELKKRSRAVEYEAYQSRIQSILDLSGAYFPSFYEHYKNSRTTPNFKIYGEMIRVILKLSDGKPVVIYTWDRYHDGGTQPYQFERLEAQAYKDMLLNILSQSSGGDKVDGVIVWGADGYFYSASFAKDSSGKYIYQDADWDQKRLVFQKECLVSEVPQDCIDRLSRATYENTYDVIKSQ
jgi:hypothetical protein